jgi:hypothetical protein
MFLQVLKNTDQGRYLQKGRVVLEWTTLAPCCFLKTPKHGADV